MRLYTNINGKVKNEYISYSFLRLKKALTHRFKHKGKWIIIEPNIIEHSEGKGYVCVMIQGYLNSDVIKQVLNAGFEFNLIGSMPNRKNGELIIEVIDKEARA